MHRGSERPVIDAALIRGAVPRDTHKTIASWLGCTVRQGRRIAAGRVPRRYRADFLRLLDETYERNEAEIRRARAELRAIEHAQSVAQTGGLVARKTPPGDRGVAPSIPGG